MARLGNRLQKLEDTIESPTHLKEVILVPHEHQAETITYKGKTYRNDATLEDMIRADGYRNILIISVHEGLL